ncbi:sugar ABC transporter ATP-binding protein [Rhizobium vallis]|uniref:Sugar ABC transporter ATP-binding protein n=1 Tax=Rhizobium vallis TaxID=634290 RepID=A0A432PK92_9HYPH|nr:sugar ABC transporter ATP-binding protein [Rhizobium vallis]RUM24431.1 sugar ABC transporter ATP-binding protein [Rhizobium vallis]
MAEPSPAVVATGISKTFGAVHALDDVSLSVKQGSSLALFGRNGAGKSTLISIITGLQKPDTGTLEFGNFGAGGGIECVYQRSTLVPGFTAAENVSLNNYHTKAGAIDWRVLRRRGVEMLAEWDCADVANIAVENLAPVEKKIVEICRALSRNPSVLLLDEPTAGLDYASAQRLFARIREARSRGVSLIFVSHHLEESFDVCDHTVVLRDGRVVLDRKLEGLGIKDIVGAMIGETRARSDAIVPTELPNNSKRLLAVENLSIGNGISEIDLSVSEGECVGLAGLEGAGHMRVAQAICGLRSDASGTVSVGDKQVSGFGVPASLKAGIGFIPEDRHDGGYVPALSVSENATLPIMGALRNSVGMLTRSAREKAYRHLSGAWSIKSDGPDQPVEELSGGNQQKVVLARAMSTDPRVIVLMNPTAGVDVAAKWSIYETVKSNAAAGKAVLIASAEDDDFSICHRVIVMFRGKFHRELKAPFSGHELALAIQGE